MNRFLSFIFFLSVSHSIIPSESSADSYSPKDESSSQDLLEYNPYAPKRRSKKRKASNLSDKKTTKKKEFDFNDTHLSSNNNYNSFSPNGFCFVDTSSFNDIDLDEYQSNMPLIHRSPQSNNNNNAPSIDTYHFFITNFQSNKENKEVLLRETIFNEIKKMEPAINNQKKTEELNKKFLEKFKEENPLLKDLDVFFKTLQKHNSSILYSEALAKVLEVKKKFKK